MDRMIYLSMSGAKATMQRQDTLANNLANVSTVGFRAELAAFRAVPVRGQRREHARLRARSRRRATTPTPGQVAATGRNLDVAMKGNAWLAVQGLDGTEAYTRAGSLDVDADGKLVTRSRPDGARRRRPDPGAAEQRGQHRAPTAPSAPRAANGQQHVGRQAQAGHARGAAARAAPTACSAPPTATCRPSRTRACRTARSKARTSARSRRWSR